MALELLADVSLDHIGIVGPGATEAPLAGLLTADLIGRPMPSGVAVAYFGPDDCLEAIWPTRSGTPVDRFLERRGPGLHHLAFAVPGSLAALSARLERGGVRLAGPVEPDGRGRASLFIHPSAAGGVLVELVEGRR